MMVESVIVIDVGVADVAVVVFGLFALSAAVVDVLLSYRAGDKVHMVTKGTLPKPGGKGDSRSGKQSLQDR